MTQLIALISSFRNDDEGQGLAEYALILALIAIVAIVALVATHAVDGVREGLAGFADPVA